MFKVFIDGNLGTTGLRIGERLRERGDIRLLSIAPELKKDANERRRLINESDITFLCLPDDAAREAVSLCENSDTVIIDASTAHRTEPDWAYGFPELSGAHREKIASSKRIAVPGCHASGFISIVYPLLAHNIMKPDYPCVCHSLTGYSGGGRKMIAQYETEKSDELYAPRQYGLTQLHKHLKEMKAVTGLNAAPLFTPIVDDFYCGMATTVPLYASLLGSYKKDDVYECLKEHYTPSRVVSVERADDASFISSNILSGRDSMTLYVAGCEERIFITSVFDNLGKGASGAAVQCMNISMGEDETDYLKL